MDGCMDEWLGDGWMEACITGKMHGWVFGWVGEQVSEWMVKGMTGWMDEQTDGQIPLGGS